MMVLLKEAGMLLYREISTRMAASLLSTIPNSESGRQARYFGNTTKDRIK
jgi:hypothetical protein